MLALPRWAETALRGKVDGTFQCELMESTISGYLFIRLIDDVMDRDPRAAPELLPLAGLLHTMFERVYHRHFDVDSPFWMHFHAAWNESAEAAARDAMQRDHDQESYEAVASRKLAAAKIPVTAVCVRAGRADLAPQWMELCTLVGRHEQLLDDLLDWHRDAESGRVSWILSEARRRSPHDPTVWLVREGLRWANGHLDDYADEIFATAAQLQCTAIVPWMMDRRALVAELMSSLGPGMEALAALTLITEEWK